MPKTRPNTIFRFKDKQLFIRQIDTCDYKIRVWPRPVAECMEYNKSRWERCYPGFRLINYPPRKPKKKNDPNQLELSMDLRPPEPNPIETKKDAYEQLRQTLPTGYAMALASFKSHQWNMIVFLSFHGRFYELIRSNPALAFTLANRREFNWRVYRKEIKLEDLTGMKQTDLLELVGLPGIKNVVQITKKIHPSSVTPKLVETLQKCLRKEDIVKKLSHLKKINAGVLSLMQYNQDIRSMVTPQLLEEISTNRSNNHYPIAAQELLESLRWHRELRPGRRFPVLRTLEALTAYHEAMVSESERLLAETMREAQRSNTERYKKLTEINKAAFPKTPIKGTDSIVPLRTGMALLREGQQQHNCVGSYTHRVHSGECYIYQILQPERATLSIVKAASGEWRIGELFTACNSPVRPETKLAASEWLSNAQLGI